MERVKVRRGDPEVKSQAKYLRAQGMTYQQISEKLDFSLSTVRSWVNDEYRERCNANRRRPASRDQHNTQRRERHRNNPAFKILKSARERAKRSQMEFNLTLQDIIIPDYCPYLGIKLFPGDGKQHDNSPTLDRINPRRGYLRDNIIIVSYKANTMKRDATPQEVVEFGAHMASLIESDARFRSGDDI